MYIHTYIPVPLFRVDQEGCREGRDEDAKMLKGILNII